MPRIRGLISDLTIRIIRIIWYSYKVKKLNIDEYFMSNNLITVKDIVCDKIQKGKSFSFIIKKVIDKHPHSKINESQIKFYVNLLFKLGVIDAEHKAKYIRPVRGRPITNPNEHIKIIKKPHAKNKKLSISDEIQAYNNI